MTTLAALPLLATGKVREMYDLGDRILMVASDRISTYDVVHPTPIPDKGKVLTALSVFWFEQSGDIVPNHLVSITEDVPDEVRGRALAVRKLEMLPVECVVRGYITGSGWKDYQATGRRGRDRAARGPARVRAAARADLHALDEGRRRPRRDDRLRPGRGRSSATGRSWRSCATCRSRCTPSPPSTPRSRGVILADTKFEFGRDADGVLRVGDEVLTPDSSRFWPADSYEVGKPQPTFDKQYVRDWASGTGWDKKPPAPAIPDDVVAGTRARYVEAYEKITGEPFDDWLARVAA